MSDARVAGGGGKTVSCRSCGYRLGGSKAGRCSECGTRLTTKQRLQLGLPARPDVAEDLIYLLERTSGLGVERETLAMRLAGSPDDDEIARTLLPEGRVSKQLYRIIRSGKRSCARALCDTLEVLRRADGATIDDEAARAALPEAAECRKLYGKLRELGYDPLDVLKRIMPHAPSYEESEATL